MNKIFNYIAIGLALVVFPTFLTTAGNPDRVGQSGASELLINPWARSSGVHGLNSASVRGIEAMRLNIAGMSFTEKTELVVANSQWLRGSGVTVNSVGFSQRVGAAGALGLSIMTMGFGEIEITTSELPEGGIGTYKPQFLNIGLGYSKVFSNSIYGGFALRAVSESIADVSAQGLAIDAGIQYVTGATEQIKFGIALRNIGVPMRFSGDGLSFRGTSPDAEYLMTLNQRSERFELPSLLNIGAAYDFKFQTNPEDPTDYKHRLTLMGNFTSNSFTADEIGAGIEYSFLEYFMVRAGYRYAEGITKETTRISAFTGLAGGFTVELPLKKDGPTAALDYSYRDSNPFSGTHTIGARISL